MERSMILRMVRSALLAAAMSPLAVAAQAIPTWTDITPGGVSTSHTVFLVPGNPGALFLTRASNLGARSLDGGRTWQTVVTPELPIAFLGAPTEPGTVYAATMGSRLERSRDLGASWETVNVRMRSPRGLEILSVKVGASPGLLFGSEAAPLGGCFAGFCDPVPGRVVLSEDGGATWKDVGNIAQTLAPPVDAVPAPGNAAVLYGWARKDNAVLLVRSRDRGLSWKVVGQSAARTEPQLVIDGTNPDIVYVRFPYESGPIPITITLDGGEHWATPPQPEIGLHAMFTNLVADPLEAGRAYLVSANGLALETRDAGASWHALTLVERSSGGSAGSAFATRIGMLDGQRVLVDHVDGRALRTHKLAIADTLLVGADFWWNPAKSGMGWSLTQHASGQMFVVWYHYDANGDATWLYMPGGSWNGRQFSGELHATSATGSAASPFDPASVTSSAVGTATLSFADPDHARFSYRIGAADAQEEPLERFRFVPNGFSLALSDIYYNSEKPGWGLSVVQQGALNFAAAYGYNPAGKPTWMLIEASASTARVCLPGRAACHEGFNGTLYMMRGPAAGTAYDPAKVSSQPAGSGSFLVYPAGEEILFQYALPGAAATAPIARLGF
jgi:photosystem II stability/assembly factor-like uncharacterized protein